VSDKQMPHTRRDFLRTSLLAITTVAIPASETDANAQQRPVAVAHRYFTDVERRFLRAAVDRLIPADEWPSASELNVVEYIDLQMAGSWGHGDLSSRTGPFHPGTPSQGYQLEYTPAELFRRSILAIGHKLAESGKQFHELPTSEQDTFLTTLQTKHLDLNGVPSPVFFGLLWKHTLEGYFADPIYGGNKDKMGWKMIGFPGAYTDFYDLVDQHNVKFERAPIGIADGMQMHARGK